jgi:hypothetical protein
MQLIAKSLNSYKPQKFNILQDSVTDLPNKLLYDNMFNYAFSY